MEVRLRRLRGLEEAPSLRAGRAGFAEGDCCWGLATADGAEDIWEAGREEVCGMIGSSEVIGDRELSRVSSARTNTGREAAFEKPLTADGGYCSFPIFVSNLFNVYPLFR